MTPEKASLRILSLGAGVQSSTLALLFAHRVITPAPDCAIFADTGAEPATVYRWLDFLTPLLPFPVYRVRHDRGLTEHILSSARGNSRWAGPPFFTESFPGRRGMLRRICTREFKINPIRQKIRKLLGVSPRKWVPRGIVVEQYMGISTDEYLRAKPAREPWIRTRFPLLEMRFSRADCLAWLKTNHYPAPPRSACVFCPYRSDSEWQELRDTSPADFAEAARIDEAIRNGVKATKQRLFVHGSLQPLRRVNFIDAPAATADEFNEECVGVCGV